MSQVSLPQKLSQDLPLTALAPMQDVTNHWFMKVIAHYGSPDYFFTEYFRVNDTSQLLQRMLKHDPASLSCLQRILTGGAALSPAIAQIALEQLGPVIFNLYGTSEAGFGILGTLALLGRKPASIGQPVWGVRTKIVNHADQKVSLC